LISQNVFLLLKSLSFILLGIKETLVGKPGGSDRQIIAENASLELCDSDVATCEPSHVTVSVHLLTTAESMHCPVDQKSIDARNTACSKFFAYILRKTMILAI